MHNLTKEPDKDMPTKGDSQEIKRPQNGTVFGKTDHFAQSCYWPVKFTCSHALAGATSSENNFRTKILPILYTVGFHLIPKRQVMLQVANTVTIIWCATTGYYRVTNHSIILQAVDGMIQLTS
jgi:hypothetical protein